MRTAVLCWCIGLGSAPALAPPLVAAAADGETAPAALLADEESLVRYALQHNPELQAARWSGTAADAAVTSAGALASPVVRAEWLHVQAPDDYGFGIGLEWTPPMPGVYGSRREAAHAGARAVHADLQERAAELEASVRVAYAEARTWAEQLELLERSVSTRRALQEATRARMQRGAANRIELSLASVGLARAEQEQARSALSARTAVAQIEQLIGLGPEQRLQLPPPDAAPATGSEGSAANEPNDGELVKQALASRPLLQADRERQTAAEEALSAERAKRWPWLELQARYRRRDQSQHSNDFTLGASISIPLPGHQSGPIAALEADLQRERALSRAHRDGVQREIRALQEERARYAEISAHYAESIAPVLSEHAVLVKAALAGLELDLTALFTAEEMVTQGGLEYLQARLATRRAEIALERSLGRYGRDWPKAEPMTKAEP
jgi:outer membrane protein TolC